MDSLWKKENGLSSLVKGKVKKINITINIIRKAFLNMYNFLFYAFLILKL